MATTEEKQKLVEVLKEGPYKYYKVVVNRTTISEAEYFVKHKITDGEFDAHEYTRELEFGDYPENWREEYHHPNQDSYEPEIASVEECDKDGEVLK